MDSLIAGLPSNVAVLARIVCDENADVGNRWRSLTRVVEQLLRFSTLPLLAEYLRGAQVHPGLTENLRGLSLPTFETRKQLAWFTTRQRDFFAGTALARYHMAFSRACETIWKRKVQVPPNSDSWSGTERTLLGAFQAHRNLWAHHEKADPPVARQQRDLATYVPVLREILTAFAFLADPTMCRFQSIGAGVVVDHHGIAGDGATPDVGGSHRPDVVAVLRTHGVEVPFGSLFAVVANGANRWLAPIRSFRLRNWASPLVIEYDVTEGALTLEGEATQAFRQQLLAKSFVPESHLRDVHIWTLAEHFRSSSVVELEMLQARDYDHASFVERRDLQVPLQEFVAVDNPAASCFVLTGVAGSGKTAMLMELARVLLAAPEEHAVLFLRGGQLDREARDGNGPVLDHVLRVGLISQDEVRTPKALLNQLASGLRRDKSTGRKLVLIVDAIDESSESRTALLEMVEMALAARQFPWVRIVVSLREEMLDVFRGIRSVVRLPLNENEAAFLSPPPNSEFRHAHLPVWVVPDLHPEEREHIYERYRATKPSTPGREACRTPWSDLPEESRTRVLVRPLMIRAWMTAFDGREAPADIVTPHQLIQAVLKELKTKAPDARHTLRCLASYVIETGNFPLKDDKVLDDRLGGGAIVDKAILLGVLKIDTDARGQTTYSGRHERSVEVLVMEEVMVRGLDPRAIACWREWPVTKVLVAAMELLVEILLGRGHYEDAGRVLGAIDLQLAPQSSMLFQAGRVEAAIRLRERLDPHLDPWPALQRENRYQLGIGYMRRNRMDDARNLHDGLLAHVGSVPTPQEVAVMIYTSLRLRHRARALIAKGKMAEGRRELGQAIRTGLRAWKLARGDALRGNALGHLAMARLEASGAMSAGASTSFMRPSSLQGWRGWWWRIRFWPRIRIAQRSFELAARLNDRPGSSAQRDLRSSVHWRTMLARLLLRCDEIEKAIREAERAELRLSETFPDAKCSLDLHWLLAMAYWAAGRPDDDIVDRFDKAMKLAAESGDTDAYQGIQADVEEYHRQRPDPGVPSPRT